MARSQLFVKKRDGSVEVLLNQFGRDFVRVQFQLLHDAHEEVGHQWTASLSQPIDPSRDLDDPLRTLERQKATASNAELALLTVDEPTLNTSEAWAWLSSLQLALRATASAKHLATSEDLEQAAIEDLDLIHSLQQLLFELADALS